MASAGIRVLACDDNREFCALLKEYFASTPDIELVGEAHNGLDALQAINETRPDVLILDLIMPYLDGIGVLERLGQTGLKARPKILVLSALGQESFARRVFEMGADYYLVKPFDLDLLGTRVRELAAGKVAPGTTRMAPGAQAGYRSLEEVHQLIRELGVPPHVKGYRYLGDAVLMVLQQPELLGAVTKGLYPAVARHYRTTASRVERAIRHAIALAWDRSSDRLSAALGHLDGSRAKPTNSEFIALVADRLRAGYKAS